MTTLTAPAPVDHATPPAAVGAPARPPTYSDEPAVEAAVGSGLACLYPAGENYRTNMAMLADHADRSAALRADLDAFKAEVSPAADPGDTESDPRDWPAWTDEERWTTVAPEPAPRPRPFEPTPAERSWWAAECERLGSRRARDGPEPQGGITDEDAPRPDGRRVPLRQGRPPGAVPAAGLPPRAGPPGRGRGHRPSRPRRHGRRGEAGRRRRPPARPGPGLRALGRARPGDRRRPRGRYAAVAFDRDEAGGLCRPTWRPISRRAVEHLAGAPLTD